MRPMLLADGAAHRPNVSAGQLSHKAPSLALPESGGFCLQLPRFASAYDKTLRLISHGTLVYAYHYPYYHASEHIVQ